MTRHASWAGVCMALAVFLAPREAGAVTRQVPSEYTTIQAGVDASASGDSVLVAPGTYTDYEVRIVGGFPRTACLFLKDGVVVRSEGGPGITTIDMQHVIQVQANVIFGTLLSAETLVEGFTITGVVIGRSAAFIYESAKVTFRECVFRDLDGGEGTAGAVAAGYSDIDLIGCEFVNCVGGLAAGIYQLDARLYVSGCSFFECERGIAVEGEPGPNAFELVVQGSQFVHNHAAVAAGALSAVDYSGGIYISGCYFEGCETEGSGGAASLGGLGPITVQECVFWRNRTTAPGSGPGALLVARGGTVTGNTFVENAGGHPLAGGALMLAGGTWNLSNNVFASTSSGAAVRAYLATMTGGCNVFWANVDGNTTGYAMFATDREVDPQFCDQLAGDFHVTAASPCLPPYSLGCDLIGALEQGCEPVSVRNKNWGTIKGAYR